MASSPIGGAIPAQLPGAAGKTDKQIVKTTAAKLAVAIKNTNDPELKAHFSQALAGLHKYLAQDSKARKQGSVSKTSIVRDPKPKKG